MSVPSLTIHHHGLDEEDTLAHLSTLTRRFSLADLLSGNSDDPRVGSSRDGSSGGTISSTSSSKSGSLAKLGATFIPVAVILVVCLLVFIVLRRRCHRVYAPRTVATLSAPAKPSTALPNGWINWVKPFFKTPDEFVLNYGSLDGYFFLRYIKVLRTICFAGCLIVWPVLLPIHGTGGNGNTQLEMLTLGNVADQSKFFAHALVAWVFFGFVLYMIVRECIFYINIRQAYLSSPHYAERLSSRTILLTSVPQPYLNENRLKRLYGEAARRIWIPRSTKTLAKLVKEREETATRLEKAEIDLIKKANASRQKAIKKGTISSQVVVDPEIALAPRRTSTVKENGTEQQRRLSPVSDTEGSSLSSTLTTPRVVVYAPSETQQSEEPPIQIFPPNDVQEFELSRDGDEFELLSPIDTTQFQLDIDPNKSQRITEKRDESPEDVEYTHPYGLSPSLPDLRGSVAAQYLPAQARPHHRPMGNFGRRVDTIRWTRKRLKELNLQIYKMRKSIRTGKLAESSTLPAVFIEFDTQEAAQAAHQVVAHHRPLHMATRLIGVRPDEVVWRVLGMTWWEKIMRKAFVMAFIVAAIIFWSIPCAAIGIISNVDTLSGISFLHWLDDLPGPILGFLQGFVPATALSLWMAAVPVMLRSLAVQAGRPTLISIELYTQNAYFAFQIVQVFLITTLTSAASGALTEIVSNPAKIKDLLAQNLPKASNFYLSYILIQCLASGAFNLLHIFELIRHHLISRISAIPRNRYRAWKRLRLIHYGGVFPVYTNMGVIVLAYSCIAPLILIFAALGMTVTHVIWKYNITYVFDSRMDSKGLFYPRALTQLIIGLYVAELCLIGLFALKLAIGPLLLMVLFAVFSVVLHMSVREAIKPLLINLPQTLKLDEEVQQEEKAALESPDPVGGAASDYYDAEQAFGDEDDQIESEPEEESDDETHVVNATRGMEGASGVRSAIGDWLKVSTKAKVDSHLETSGLSKMRERLSAFSLTPEKPNLVTKWLHPEIYEDFIALRRHIPEDIFGFDSDASKSSGGERVAEYMPPEMWAPKPTLWIPRDEARVSRQEVAHTRKVAPISDRGAWLDEKGSVFVDMEEAPVATRRAWI